ncbi:MAG TPA: hypothetical protein VEK08_26155 [Planctomycetota bacterium]|nr:hypothetical protein [Planctomycetota bacterium]
MRLYAVVSHDLDPRSAAYEAVKLKVAKMALYDAITSSDGRLLQLTGNVWVGKYDETKWNPLSLRYAIVGAIEQIYIECNVRGRVFVITGMDCPWWVTSV